MAMDELPVDRVRDSSPRRDKFKPHKDKQTNRNGFKKFIEKNSGPASRNKLVVKTDRTNVSIGHVIIIGKEIAGQESHISDSAHIQVDNKKNTVVVQIEYPTINPDVCNFMLRYM